MYLTSFVMLLKLYSLKLKPRLRMPHYSGRAGRAQVAPAGTAEPGCWAACPPARLSLHPEGGGTQAACEGMSTRGRIFTSLQFRWADSDLRTFTPSEPLGTAPQVPAARRPFPASPSAAVPRSALLRCPERTGAPSLAPCPFPCAPLHVRFPSLLSSLSRLRARTGAAGGGAVP